MGNTYLTTVKNNEISIILSAKTKIETSTAITMNSVLIGFSERSC
jgi:hypothetical protein